MATNEQSNRQRGMVRVTSGEDLSGKEGLLAVLNSDGEAVLPNAATDLALYIIIDGGDADGDLVDLEPLEPAQQCRIRINGTGSFGDVVCLETPDGTNDGKITVETVAGLYFSPGILLEDAVDEQLALIRPFPRLLVIEAAVISDPASAAAITAANPAALTAPAAGAGSGADGTTYSGAQCDALRADVAAIHAEVVKLVTDVTAVRTGSEANNAAIDSLINATQAAGLVAIS